MTIEIPKNTIADKILRFLGKRRAINVPDDKRFGGYGYFRAHKDSFWRALFRRKGKKLPEGTVDSNSFRIDCH